MVSCVSYCSPFDTTTTTPSPAPHNSLTQLATLSSSPLCATKKRCALSLSLFWLSLSSCAQHSAPEAVGSKIAADSFAVPILRSPTRNFLVGADMDWAAGRMKAEAKGELSARMKAGGKDRHITQQKNKRDLSINQIETNRKKKVTKCDKRRGFVGCYWKQHRLVGQFFQQFLHVLQKGVEFVARTIFGRASG